MVGTVVVGGGAAGIAAARRLRDVGEEVLLIEAGDRLGGRALSVRLDTVPFPDAFRHPGLVPGAIPRSDEKLGPSALPYTSGVTGDVAQTLPPIIDLGCGWLHSAGRNPWTSIAQRDGFAIDRSSPNWGVQWRDLGFPPEDRAAFGTAYEQFETAAHAALDGPDQPLSSFISADDRWRPLTDAISGYANGAALDQVSLHDWAAYEDAATDDNWALPAGYGTLVIHHAGDIPVRLDTPVTRIDHHGRRIRLDTPAGMMEADRVILAIPTTAYANIRFDPPLPDKQAAAAALPLGVADKVFLAVDRPEWPAHAHLIGDPHRVCTASHRLSPFGLPIVESFFGGPCAEGMPDVHAAIDFAIGELVALLGSDWRARLTPLGTTRWRDAPHIHGSYSHARVGHAPARTVLAQAIDNRLFFAGEACSTHDFSTAHGAYQTGVDAADAILRLKRHPPRR